MNETVRVVSERKHFVIRVMARHTEAHPGKEKHLGTADGREGG
jgi:hypothetical protein